MSVISKKLMNLCPAGVLRLPRNKWVYIAKYVFTGIYLGVLRHNNKQKIKSKYCKGQETDIK